MLGSGEGVYDEAADAASLNLDNPIFRDTATVFKGGWTVIRFMVRRSSLCAISLCASVAVHIYVPAYAADDISAPAV